MIRLRTHAPAVVAIAIIAIGWIACGPLTGQEGQSVQGVVGGGDGSMGPPPFDAPPDISIPPPFDAPPFDAPPDIMISPPFDAAREGGMPDAPPFDAAREGGMPDAPPFDAPPFDAPPFDALPDVPMGELPPDGPMPPVDAPVVFVDAPVDAPPDAPIDAAVSPPTDAPIVADADTRDAARIDAAGMNGTSLRYDDISFYDCRCSNTSSPLGGWPIAAVLGLLIFRRRSGSSSAR